MRLWGYYAVHSFINAFKKLIKTWLGIFLCIFIFAALFGGVVGIVANSISKNAGKEVTEEADVSGGNAKEAKASYFEEHHIDKLEFTGAICSVVIIGLLAMYMLNSKTAGNIFKPGDIAMLFAAPMKPQSVMLFRLVFTLGLQIFASFYMLFQLPNLIINAKLPVYGAFSILIAWALLAITSTLLQVTIYTLSTKNERTKKIFNYAIYGILAAILIGFVLFEKTQNTGLLECAIAYFGNKNTYWVPFWGWMRGVIDFALVGDVTTSLIFIGINIVSFVLLIVIIWNINADFYEEAITSTEKQAEAVALAKQNGTRVRLNKKDRSDKLMRDGFDKGFGANVFFHKTLYNRRRFAYGHVITKTMITYFIGIGLLAYFLRNLENGMGFVAVAAVATLIAFYRTLGNPLQEDTSREFFVMIPEKASAKLFWSVLGGLMCCFLDVVVPLVGAGIFLKADVATIIVMLLFVIANDFYGTTVGTFIAISVPVNAGDKVKQMIQIMFIYFGIIPAAVFIVLGIVFKNMLLFGSLGVLGIVLLGVLFFAMTPHFFENGNK